MTTIRNEKVSQVMSSNLVTVHEGNKLSEVRTLLRQHKIHHIPVVDGTRFIGLLSSNDLLRAGWGDPYTQDQRKLDTLLDTQDLRELMQEDVKTILPTATLAEAATAFVDGSFHCLPVVTATGVLVGMLTTTDLIRLLLLEG